MKRTLSFDPEIRLNSTAPSAAYCHPTWSAFITARATSASWKAGLEAADDYRMEPAEVIDLGDRLLVIGRRRGRGTSSGVPFDEPLLSLFTLQRGLVVRLKDFAARDKALQAAGLRE